MYISNINDRQAMIDLVSVRCRAGVSWKRHKAWWGIYMQADTTEI